MTLSIADPRLEWDLSDRMRKAMRVADVTTTDVANYVGVSRALVSGWLNGYTTPRIGMLRLLATYCDVPFEWLCAEPQLPRLDSNQQPFD